MKKIAFTIIVLILSTQSLLAQNGNPRRLDFPNNVDDSQLCHDRRVAFINEHRKGNQQHYSVEEILGGKSFENLCPPDRSKFRDILASTVRVFVNEDEGQTTGTLINSNQILLVYPETTDNSWYTQIKRGKFEIKVVSYTGEEADVNVVSIAKLQHYTPMGMILNLEKQLTLINPKIRPTGVTLGLPSTTVRYNHPLATFVQEKDHNGQTVVDVKEINKQVFTFGYDNETLNIGFGMSTAQNSLRCCATSESDYYFVLYPQVAVTSQTIGGGLFNEEFQLVGFHYRNDSFEDELPRNNFIPIYK